MMFLPDTGPEIDDRTESDLRRWAGDTWAGLAAMVHPATGLPADSIGESLSNPARSRMTSPTNIGGYLWSAAAARDLGVIDAAECHHRCEPTLAALGRMRRHSGSGMFYNWYDESTGDLVTELPGTGEPVERFLSAVDNGWLAAGLMVIAAAEPALAEEASELLRGMNFGSFYDPDAVPGAVGGLLRGGFWDQPRASGPVVPGNYHGVGPDVFYTRHHYSILNSEPRMASYVGIVAGQIPTEHYFALTRGSVSYRGMQLVPTWGGSMFEALMPDLLVPEATWGPESFGRNHPLTVRAQREFGTLDAGYGHWGFSPASRPGGGYGEWGAAPLGAGAGYPSDLEGTVDADVRAGRSAYGDGVVTPHALFLALQYEPREVVGMLRHLEADFAAYGKGGFYDAVAVRSGLVAERYLSLDQAMIMASLGNCLAENAMRRYFCAGEVETALKPLLGLERFTTSRSDETIAAGTAG